MQTQKTETTEHDNTAKAFLTLMSDDKWHIFFDKQQTANIANSRSLKRAFANLCEFGKDYYFAAAFKYGPHACRTDQRDLKNIYILVPCELTKKQAQDKYGKVIEYTQHTVKGAQTERGKTCLHFQCTKPSRKSEFRDFLKLFETETKTKNYEVTTQRVYLLYQQGVFHSAYQAALSTQKELTRIAHKPISRITYEDRVKYAAWLSHCGHCSLGPPRSPRESLDSDNDERMADANKSRATDIETETESDDARRDRTSNRAAKNVKSRLNRKRRNRQRGRSLRPTVSAAQTVNNGYGGLDGLGWSMSGQVRNVVHNHNDNRAWAFHARESIGSRNRNRNRNRNRHSGYEEEEEETDGDNFWNF